MGRLLNLRTWRRFNDPVLGLPRGHLPESPTVWGEGARKAGSEGARNAGPESQPNPASLPSGGNFPGCKQGGRGRRGGGSPRGDRELRARGARRGARGERGGRRLLPSPPPVALPPPSARLGLPCSLPSWLAPAAASAAAGGEGVRRSRGVGGEGREGKFQVEGRPPAGASSRSPPAASWRSRAARPCTSSSPSRRPR